MRLNGSIDISQIKHRWKGEWNGSEIYYLNDVVKYNGIKFVCIDTELSDSRKYGNAYRPTVANEYWQEFSYGYLWRDGWNYRDHYYPGDVIKWNSDWYVCNKYNFGGHPVYENGSLSTNWTKILDTGETNKCSNHIWFANYEPMGWTRNMCSNGYDYIYRPYAYQSIGTINGNFEFAFMGRSDSTTTTTLADNYVAEQCNFSFDFWDYYDGYRPSITGGVPKCIQVFGHYSHVMFLFDNGEIYAAGYNGNYQLGNGETTNRGFPARIGRTKYDTSPHRRTGILRDVFIIKAAASEGINESTYIHCLLLDNQGQVWSWGYNGYGQLGHGHVNLVDIPKKIDTKFFDYAKIVDIWTSGTGSYGCSFALDENGQVWAWGYNTYGVLGIGNYSIDRCVRPVKQTIDWMDYGGIKKINLTGNSDNSSHGGHVLTNDGSMWVFGGSMGYAGFHKGFPTNDTYSPYPEKMSTILQNDLKTNGNLNNTQVRELGQATDVVDNVADFWSSGYGNQGKLFMKEKITNAMFAAGYSSGSNNSILSQQEQINEVDRDNPWGNADLSYPILMDLGNFKDIKDVCSVGAENTNQSHVFLDSGGTVMVNGSSTANTVKGIGVNHTTVEFSKAAYTWERDITISSTPIQVRNLNNVAMISSQGSTAGIFAITTDNKVKFWGNVNTTYSLTPRNSIASIHNPITLNNY